MHNFVDLFPTYPAKWKEQRPINYYNGMEYYDVNMLKKEFRVLSLSESESRPNIGQPLKHQEFVSKFMSPLTLNDRLIAFHGLGTGKTCLSVQFAELARKLNKKQKKTLVLVRGPTSKRNFMRELANVCTDGDYIPANIEVKDKKSDAKKFIKLTPEQRNIRMGKLIRKNYEIDTFIKFANDISKLSDELVSEIYSDRYIIVDEAHNLRFQPKESKVSLYDQIHRLMHLAQRTKILLLTATPMRDRPNEIISLLNLLLPSNKQLDQKKFDDVYEDNIKLRKTFYGLVSYVRQMESNVKKIMEGSIAPIMKKIYTERHGMKSIQNNTYKKVWIKESSGKNIDDINDSDDDDEDVPEGTGGLFEKSRQVSLMVFPDGTFGKEAVSKKEYITVDKRGFWHFTKKMKEYLEQDGDSDEKKLKRLETLSSKYAFIIRQIMSHKNEKVFVYCSFVRGSGILLFAALLEYFQFEQLNTDIFKDTSDSGSSEDDITYDEKTLAQRDSFDVEVLRKNKNRFAVITGDSVSSAAADKIMNLLYNNSKNTYGDYLRIILGSHVVGEGASLYAVRQLHIASPHWNNSVTEQAIGRGLRTFAHDMLQPDERYIKIYRHASVYDEDDFKKSIEMRMYKLSEDKDIAIKKVERAMKESAVDCYLNKKRNIRLDIDKNNSSSCDYQNCNYSCAFIDEDTVADDDNVISDTYNMFFADTEINIIIQKLKVYFGKQESADLLTLLDIFSEHLPILIVRALRKMIDNIDEVLSKNGFSCYLKEDANFYYLTKRIDYPSLFFNSGYANIPEISPSIKLEDVIQVSEESDKNIDEIVSAKYDETTKEGIMKKFRQNLTDEQREMFLEQFFIAKKIGINKNKEFRNDFLDFFQNYIYELNDKYISFYLRPKLFYIDKSIISKARTEYLENEEISSKTLSELEWKEAGEDVLKEFDDFEARKREELNKNPFGYYAVLTEDKSNTTTFGEFNFKISTIREAKITASGKVDKRIIKNLNPGTKCGTGTFKIPVLKEMMFNAVKILLENGEKDETKYPDILYLKKKNYNYTYSDVEKDSDYEDLDKDIKKILKKGAKDNEWLLLRLVGITNMAMKSCEDIKNWFIKNDLFTFY